MNSLARRLCLGMTCLSGLMAAQPVGPAPTSTGATAAQVQSQPFTPQQRAAFLEQRRQRVRRRLAVLRRKQAAGTLSQNEKRQLVLLERLEKRFAAQQGRSAKR